RLPRRDQGEPAQHRQLERVRCGGRGPDRTADHHAGDSREFHSGGRAAGQCARSGRVRLHRLSGGFPIRRSGRRSKMTEEITQPTSKSAPASRAADGPFDESEANPIRPYIDLGGIKILPREGLNLRLEVEEQSKRIVAVGLDYADSTLQVQPFAAPRNAGLWEETREQIRTQIDRKSVVEGKGVDGGGSPTRQHNADK